MAWLVLSSYSSASESASLSGSLMASHWRTANKAGSRSSRINSDCRKSPDSRWRTALLTSILHAKDVSARARPVEPSRSGRNSSALM